VFRHRLIFVLAAVLAAGLVVAGFERQAANAAPKRETPAQKIVRLRSKAARVQRVIERMNVRVERLVEDYNEVREKLGQTRVEQARTERRIADARRRQEELRRRWPPTAAPGSTCRG
jgi:septal ring factor EnvC (AmiA/AmiB activator)